MTDWTTDDILAGRTPAGGTRSAEVRQEVAEVMGNAESVSLVVVGRNGQTVTYRINGHERTALSVASDFSAEEPPEWVLAGELWAPRWSKTTWTVRGDFSYRAEDFQGLIT